MTDIILQSGLRVAVTRKAVRYFRCRVLAPDGDVKASVPWHATRQQIEDFIFSRAAWIERTHARVRARAAAQPQWGQNGRVRVWGRDYPLQVCELPADTTGKQGVWQTADGVCVRHKPAVSPVAVWEAWCKAAVETRARALLPLWTARLGVRVRGLHARQMRTRWGSCTPATGRIRLSTQLMAFPEEFLEYVLVHELAHLLEARHNARFYAILDAHLPEWRVLRARLRA